MKTTYQPKGSLCANCSKKSRDCSHLPFNAMPNILTHESHNERTVIVRCSEFVSTEREFTK